MGNHLNAVAQDAVRIFNHSLRREVANFVDLRPVYDGKEACKPRDNGWINGFVFDGNSSRWKPDNQSFHPKPIGHEKAFEAVQNAMNGGGDPGDPNPFPDLYPLQTWTLDVETTVKLWRLIDGQGAVQVQLSQMADANGFGDPIYHVTFKSIGRVGSTISLDWIGVPLGGELGVYKGEGTSFTVQFTAAELKWLDEQGLPFVPTDEGILDNVDSSGVDPFAIGEIVRFSVLRDLRGALENADIPFIPSNDVFNRLTNFTFPSDFSVEGELRSEYEIRKKIVEPGWEILRRRQIVVGYEVLTDGESTGGIVGSVIDVLTAIDLDNLTFSGARNTHTEELIYDLQRKTFAQNRIVKRETFTGDASQAGFDIPIFDEITDALAITIIERSTGETKSETYETMRAVDGQILEESAFSSHGVFRVGEADLILSSSTIQASYDAHTRPQLPGMDFPLSCKQEWNDCQRQQMCAKVAHYNSQVPVVRREVTQAMTDQKIAAQRKFTGDFPKDEPNHPAPWANRCATSNGGLPVEADHMLDVMYGGSPAGPIWWLDASVNNSAGGQGASRLDIGDVVSRFTTIRNCNCR